MFWVCYCFPIWWSERTICSSICTFNAKKIENLFFYIQKSLQWDVYCGVVCVGGEALFTEVFPLWWWWCFQQQQRRMRFTAQNRHKDWQRRHVDMIRLFYLWYGSLCRYRSSSGCSEVIMCVCVVALWSWMFHHNGRDHYRPPGKIKHSSVSFSKIFESLDTWLLHLV